MPTALVVLTMPVLPMLPMHGEVQARFLGSQAPGLAVHPDVRPSGQHNQKHLESCDSSYKVGICETPH